MPAHDEEHLAIGVNDDEAHGVLGPVAEHQGGGECRLRHGGDAEGIGGHVVTMGRCCDPWSPERRGCGRRTMVWTALNARCG
jgi:hypothetical protein